MGKQGSHSKYLRVDGNYGIGIISAARISNAELIDSNLNVELSYYKDRSCFLVCSSIRKPESLSAGKRDLREVADLDSVVEGWKHIKCNFLLIKVRFDDKKQYISISGARYVATNLVESLRVD